MKRKNKSLIAAVIILCLLLTAAFAGCSAPQEVNDAQDTVDNEYDAQESVDEEADTPDWHSLIDKQQEEELLTFLNILSDYTNHRDSGLCQSGQYTATYNRYSELAFGTLQAIMNSFLRGDLETYEQICPMDIDYKMTVSEAGSDPEGKSLLSYNEANADAVNWLAVNVFNATDEGLKDELEFSSGLDKYTLFYCPLYLHEGKYYICPDSRGGMAYEIRIENITIEDEYFVVDFRRLETWREAGGQDPEQGTRVHRATMQYKTADNGKGYWSLYGLTLAPDEYQ